MAPKSPKQSPKAQKSSPKKKSVTPRKSVTPKKSTTPKRKAATPTRAVPALPAAVGFNEGFLARGVVATAPSPRAGSPRPASPKPSAQAGANFVGAEGVPGWLSPLFLGALALMAICPLASQLLIFITTSTSLPRPTLEAFHGYCLQHVEAALTGQPAAKTWNVRSLGAYAECVGTAALQPPDAAACAFLAGFFGLALVLYWLPGQEAHGPLTATGHLPVYTDNGIAHCFAFSLIAGLLCYFGYVDAGAMYDTVPGHISVLNLLGLAFCALLVVKGVHFPSTQDRGTSGSYVVDYYWGYELYPRICGVDVKKFVNCRFSMTYWQLAGISFAYRSYTMHGSWDMAIVCSAIAQYVYLVKFFIWEIGYMRSIDIICDRAGFYETWGCLVFVPSMYTLHTRILVRSPAQYSDVTCYALLVFSIASILLNFWSDRQRQRFREEDGKLKIWGQKPVFIEATYVAGGRKRTSLLLASGFWGLSRHCNYLFELMAAWSWGLLSDPWTNGILGLAYCTFLTVLLVHRAERDEIKCRNKYGKDYERYCQMVPYKIVPYIY